ncbi:hypothetical protein GLOIN_2v1776283 [Rhizophagus irregularis DAOM 181602=DAOM 197198]|nr:hypothetical protein GLOIN_2v1776283 [Rhizophagus irregularis DAOM 181602=DAOM 197198]
MKAVTILRYNMLGKSLQVKTQDDLIDKDDFNKLNEVFSDRINENSGKIDGSKGKEKAGITLNENKKRITQNQGAREGSDNE